MDFLGIHWAGGDYLFLFPVFALIIVLFIKNYLRIKRSSRLLVHADNQNKIFKNFSLLKQVFKTILMSTGLLFLFLALLQPQWGKKEEQVMQEGRDLLISLDISRSMLAKDVKPNRLAFAKLKIRNLLSKLHFERVGLLVFSGSAFLECPLTADHAAFLTFLDNVDVETISSGTTAIDSALSKAVSVFETMQGKKNKLVLLVTDGEDFSSNLESVKRKAAEQNIKLFALGVGTVEGAPIPIVDYSGNEVGHETDASGKIAISALNENKLQEICKALQGTYIKSTYQDGDIDTISKLIKAFEKEKFSDKKISLYEDHYPWFLGIALCLFLLEWVL